MGWYKCKNCGKRNPFHTCYTGGGKNFLYYDDKVHKLIANQMEMNQAQGRKPFDGIPPELAARYVKGRPR